MQFRPENLKDLNAAHNDGYLYVCGSGYLLNNPGIKEEVMRVYDEGTPLGRGVILYEADHPPNYVIDTGLAKNMTQQKLEELKSSGKILVLVLCSEEYPIWDGDNPPFDPANLFSKETRKILFSGRVAETADLLKQIKKPAEERE